MALAMQGFLLARGLRGQELRVACVACRKLVNINSVKSLAERNLLFNEVELDARRRKAMDTTKHLDIPPARLIVS